MNLSLRSRGLKQQPEEQERSDFGIVLQGRFAQELADTQYAWVELAGASVDVIAQVCEVDGDPVPIQLHRLMPAQIRYAGPIVVSSNARSRRTNLWMSSRGVPRRNDLICRRVRSSIRR